LPLGGAGAFVVQHIVHGDRDQLGDLLHEMDFGRLVVAPLFAAEAHRAKATERRGQRHAAKRPHAVLTQERRERGKPLLHCDILDDERLLRHPYQSTGRLVHR